LLPVARSFWVVASSEAVDCSEADGRRKNNTGHGGSLLDEHN
jgi:hypothetical protein